MHCIQKTYVHQISLLLNFFTTITVFYIQRSHWFAENLASTNRARARSPVHIIQYLSLTHDKRFLNDGQWPHFFLALHCMCHSTPWWSPLPWLSSLSWPVPQMPLHLPLRTFISQSLLPLVAAAVLPSPWQLSALTSWYGVGGVLMSFCGNPNRFPPLCNHVHSSNSSLPI